MSRDTSTRPLLAVIPGVTGDNTKLYMVSMVKAACKNGFDMVCINYRGMGGVPLKVKQFPY
jgi:predicted alpha/beta-fold hydrolase